MHFKVGRDPVRNLWKFSTIISDGVREGSLKTLVLMDHTDSECTVEGSVITSVKEKHALLCSKGFANGRTEYVRTHPSNLSQ